MNRSLVFLALMAASLLGCAPASQVSPASQDAWSGMPVAALDQHSYLVTLPLFRAMTDDGIEIRNYSTQQSMALCVGRAGEPGRGTVVNATQLVICTNGKSSCSNLFYVKNGRVLDYVARGRCHSSELMQPEAG